MSRPNWFVALTVSAPDLPRVIGAPPRQVRVFAAEDLHATIAFLGPVGAPQALAGWRALGIALPPRAVRLGRVEPLGASALSSLLGDPEIDAAIGGARARVALAAGAPVDDRPPLGHVTIGRIARRASADERRAAIAWAGQLDLRGCAARVEAVALYTWAEDRRERLFRAVQTRALP